MVLSTLMALESLTEQQGDAASDVSYCSEKDMQIVELPTKENVSISTASGDNHEPSRRTSWKFNTDWEGAISGFRSTASSMMSASFNSWYHLLDIDEDEQSDDELDSQELENRCKVQRGKDQPFKRSLHSTLLDEERRTSFQSSLGSDHEEMNGYLESLNRSNALHDNTSDSLHRVKSEAHTNETSHETVQESTTALCRLSELLNMKCDIPDLQLIKVTKLDKDEAELVQERVNSLQDLDDELNEGTRKARAA